MSLWKRLIRKIKSIKIDIHLLTAGESTEGEVELNIPAIQSGEFNTITINDGTSEITVTENTMIEEQTTSGASLYIPAGHYSINNEGITVLTIAAL